MKGLVLSVFCLLSAGCATQDYTGKSYAPTEYVEVYFDASEVPRPYETMGRDHAEAPEALSQEQIVQQIVGEAKRRGADAVVIDNLETITIGTSTNTLTERKSKNKYYATSDGKLHSYQKPSGKYHETSYATPRRDKIVTARFLKYKGD